MSAVRFIIPLVVCVSAVLLVLMFDTSRLHSLTRRGGRGAGAGAGAGLHLHNHSEAANHLRNHSLEFIPKSVIQVTDGVFVAVGYGLANSILIEGDDGVIIVDTLESIEAAETLLPEFNKITHNKPVRAIIYTHNHADHVFGASVFASNNSEEILVYSHTTTHRELTRVFAMTNEISFRRAMRQFGTYLEGNEHINSGIGLKLDFNQHRKQGLILPNRTFSGKRMKLEISGLKLELIYAPGETDDQIVVWLPEKSVLLAADNFYRSFPNLYAIRGTPTRDALQWVCSLDLMRFLRPKFLIPSHTRPLIGEEFIFETLTAYRDAIQIVHDQTVRYLNKGFFPDEIVEMVTLPPHLLNNPYLQQFYGTIPWSVRGIFNGYMGWFSGNPVDLEPLSNLQRAWRLVRLVGSTSALLQEANKAFQSDDFQWALELSSAVLLALENPEPTTSERKGHTSSEKEIDEATILKVKALRSLGRNQISANGRNYYLTYALEEEGLEIRSSLQGKQQLISRMPLAMLFRAMTVVLDYEAALDVDQKVLFNFTDSNQLVAIHVRHGVAELQSEEINTAQATSDEDEFHVDKGLEKGVDIKVSISSTLFREFLSQTTNPAAAYLTGSFSVDVGSAIGLGKFFQLFVPN